MKLRPGEISEVVMRTLRAANPGLASEDALARRRLRHEGGRSSRPQKMQPVNSFMDRVGSQANCSGLQGARLATRSYDSTDYEGTNPKIHIVIIHHLREKLSYFVDVAL